MKVTRADACRVLIYSVAAPLAMVGERAGEFAVVPGHSLGGGTAKVSRGSRAIEGGATVGTPPAKAYIIEEGPPDITPTGAVALRGGVVCPVWVVFPDAGFLLSIKVIIG